jgi:mRNA interferase HicA
MADGPEGEPAVLDLGLVLLAVDSRTDLSDTSTSGMRGAEFVRRVRRLGRRRGVAVSFREERGKGSHGTLYYGSRFTVVRNLKDDLKKGTLHAMLKQLGLTPDDL